MILFLLLSSIISFLIQSHRVDVERNSQGLAVTIFCQLRWPAKAPLARLVGACAPGSGGIVLIGSTANELGKYNVGTSKGLADVIKNIAIDTIIDGTVEAVLKGASGRKIFEGVDEQLVNKVGSKWIGEIGPDVVREYLTAYLENATAFGLGEAIKQVGEVQKAATGKESDKALVGAAAKKMTKRSDFNSSRKCSSTSWPNGKSNPPETGLWSDSIPQVF